MRGRKLRWVLLSPEGEEVRSGLSFGTFDAGSARARALDAAAPPRGFGLRVFLDGRELGPLDGAAGTA
ncbi:MAG: hypothetical protein HYV09_13440 [Deltaproteobacteria bacterium]|nr:hypothetical protein [Deltaproteobacteria bacterium]